MTLVVLLLIFVGLILVFSAIGIFSTIVFLLRNRNLPKFGLPGIADKMLSQTWVARLIALASTAVAIVGLLIGLETFFSIAPDLIRPPNEVSEIEQLCQEGELDQAVEAAQASDSPFSRVVAEALLHHSQGADIAMDFVDDRIEAEKALIQCKTRLIDLMIALLGPLMAVLSLHVDLRSNGAKDNRVDAGVRLGSIGIVLGLLVVVPLLYFSYRGNTIIESTFALIKADCRVFAVTSVKE